MNGLKKRFNITVMEQDLSVLSDKGDEYVESVVDYVNEKAREMREASDQLTALNSAILVALNIADELFTLREEKRQLSDTVRGRTEKLIEYIDKKQKVFEPLRGA